MISFRFPFKSKVFEDENLEDTFGYWKLAKEDNNYISILEKHLSKICDQEFNTLSDIGSLKIGNDSFSFEIPNLYGDGKNYVYIINDKKDLNCIDFLTTINGNNINIYSYDCGKKIAYTLNGERWAIYRAEKHFVFVNWSINELEEDL